MTFRSLLRVDHDVMIYIDEDGTLEIPRMYKVKYDRKHEHEVIHWIALS